MSARPLVIVDSGFGGFSLVAEIEAGLHCATPLDIVYVNAAPSDALGYNQMLDPRQRQATLANVLCAIQRRLDPARVLLASHTLSTIYAGLRADAKHSPEPAPTLVAVETLLDDALALLDAAHREDPDRPVAIFGTATTARASPLRACGLPSALLHYQACPGLETLISGDPSGEQVLAQLRVYRDELRARLGSTAPGRLALMLGCTHYAHRPELFLAAFAEIGVEVELLDPGRRLAQRILAGQAEAREPAAQTAGLSISMLSRYPPPTRELSTVAALIESRAPRAAAAIAGYQWVPALFEVASAQS